jgi:hypothetical protein
MLEPGFSPSAISPSSNILRQCWSPSCPTVLRLCERLPHDSPRRNVGSNSLFGPIFSKPRDFADSVRNPNTEGIRAFDSGAGSFELRGLSRSARVAQTSASDPGCVKTRARQSRLEIDSARHPLLARKFARGLCIAVIGNRAPGSRSGIEFLHSQDPNRTSLGSGYHLRRRALTLQAGDCLAMFFFSPIR